VLVACAQLLRSQLSAVSEFRILNALRRLSMAVGKEFMKHLSSRDSYQKLTADFNAQAQLTQSCTAELQKCSDAIDVVRMEEQQKLMRCIGSYYKKGIYERKN
jgi:hypothetical protein